MMLRALAIYEITTESAGTTLTLVDASPKNESFGFFKENPLYALEKHSLQALKAANLEGAHPFFKYYYHSSEHHYFKIMTGGTHVMAMCSRKQLDDLEVYYLFTNMQHAFKRPEKAKVTLDDIMRNPLGYTGRDCHIQALRDNVEDMRQEAIMTLDKLLVRGEDLAKLEDKTIRLVVNSERIEINSRKLNRCCGWGGLGW